MKRGHKLVVVDVAVAVPVEYVRHGAHLQSAGGEFCQTAQLCSEMKSFWVGLRLRGESQALTGGEDSFDELLPGHFAVLVLVDAAEEVHDAGLLVVHPAHVALPPHVEVEVGKFFQLQRGEKKKKKKAMSNSRRTRALMLMRSVSALLRPLPACRGRR